MAELAINGGRVFYWDPRRNHLPLIKRFEIGPRVGNFGDLLGPLIVRRVLSRTPRARAASTPGTASGSRVFAVGSVMHFAADGDTIWGTGVNGKVADDLHRFSRLDVRAVRGPVTRRWLQDNRGIDAPEVYGDPALLLPQLLTEAKAWTGKKRGLGVVPNFHDVEVFRGHPGFIDPKRPPMEVLEDIVRSERIAASSLHGVIVADAFGIPAVLLPSKVESPFKYLDYAGGTGRESLPQADDLAAAETMLKGGPDEALENWDGAPLLSAFPFDRFVGA